MATFDLKVQSAFLVVQLEELSRAIDDFLWPATDVGLAQERMLLGTVALLTEHAKILMDISDLDDLTDDEKKALQRDFYEAAHATLEATETLDWLRTVIPDFRRE